MPEKTLPLLERTLLALLHLQLRDVAPDQAAEILIRSGWSNPDAAEVIGVTTNAIAVRRNRLKKGKE